ncbi:MAG: LysM peptidoglycan-binding domain-containing protein [Zetaproteobacteria bacterium]|nr:MAG: LysM peptidoglycan-binding domain-containing protein [Zetaproteobacteria bacterium]
MMARVALAAFVVMISLATMPTYADERVGHPEQVLLEQIPQPYVVQPGDTLWDIAKRFFKNPYQWLHIWERNLYITNPDLIYPGNKIWFDAAYADRGGLRVERVEPTVVVKPVQRLEPAVDPRRIVHALRHYDFVAEDELEGVGYILGSNEDRLNFGAGDALYVRLTKSGGFSAFDVFRPTDIVTDPHTGKRLGRLVIHLGRVKLTAAVDQGAPGAAIVETAFAEIEPGDRLKPAMDVDPRIVPFVPAQDYPGSVLFIMNDAAEAGQNQVVGISSSAADGVRSGMRMLVFRKGRRVKDPLSGKDVDLPDEPIGELLVIVAHRHASMALVMRSSKAINIGDAVHSMMR